MNGCGPSFMVQYSVGCSRYCVEVFSYILYGKKTLELCEAFYYIVSLLLDFIIRGEKCCQTSKLTVI